MPKSKRNKTVDLSKTKKHGLEGKKELYKKIQSNVENYAYVFVFAVNDMRNSKMKNVREQWKHSRFCIGKNKVMARALGRTPEEEYRPNLHKIGQMLIGERGLFFTNQSVDEVTKWFESYSEGDFARSGNRATEDVILQEGPLEQFPHNLESYLRQLGLPTTLKKGVIHLIKEHVVCREGEPLSPETARILKLLGYEMAEFRIQILSVWSQDGSFVSLQSDSCDSELKENANISKSFMREDFQLTKDCLALGDEEMEAEEIDSDDEIKASNNSEGQATSENTEDLEEEATEVESLKPQTLKTNVSSAEADKSSGKIISLEANISEKEQETKQVKSKENGTKMGTNEKQVDVEETSENGSNSEECASDESGSEQSEEKDVEMEEVLEPELKKPKNNSTVEKTGKKTINKKTAKKTNKPVNVDAINVENVSSEEKTALLKLTEKKLEESAEKPKKFSPKMTRARAAAANKKVKTPEPIETKRTTRKRKV